MDGMRQARRNDLAAGMPPGVPTVPHGTASSEQPQTQYRTDSFSSAIESGWCLVGFKGGLLPGRVLDSPRSARTADRTVNSALLLFFWCSISSPRSGRRPGSGLGARPPAGDRSAADIRKLQGSKAGAAGDWPGSSRAGRVRSDVNWSQSGSDSPVEGASQLQARAAAEWVRKARIRS